VLRKYYRFNLLVLFLIGLTSVGRAQISAGGQPYSFTNTVAEAPVKIKIPAVDLQQIASIKFAARKDEPVQFGYPFDVSYDLENSGSWSELPDGGRLWRLRIFAQDAYSLNLIYDNFFLAENARLFLYSTDQKMVLGAFTSANNKPHGQFATAPVKGGDCILELYEPPETRGQSRLTISRIIYGYKDVFFSETGSLTSSGSCNNDVNSSVGADWQVEKRAVAMILTGGGSRICSGALVNNVEQDLKQYLLTANHCLGSEEYWIVMFNYESPAGTTYDGPITNTVQGTTLLATSLASDFALLEINEQIPVEYNVHYAGWNAESVPARKTVCIHHPNGDVKKISFDNDAPTNDFWDSNTPANSHWAVVWDDGTTEPGSSGAPLFDQNHRIVGQLHGGSASCDDPDGVDDFGKFSYSWNYYTTTSAQLKCWLDPQNSGVLTLDGRDYYSIIFSHTALPATEDITGPYRVLASVTSTKPPLGTIWLHYGRDGIFSDSLEMQATGETDRYYADIPGGQTNVSINYYFSAGDGGLEIVTSPGNAPETYYSFYVGIDATPPQITHSALTNQPLRKWPINIEADATDNLLIDTVICQYYINNVSNSGVFGLTLNANGRYSGIFPGSAGSVNVGDIFYYRICATDGAHTPNVTCCPTSGYFSFRIIDVNGLALIVDDDIGSKSQIELRADAPLRSAKSYGETSQQVQRWLTDGGYYAEIVNVAAADTLDFATYDLVISTSGANQYPVSDRTYREKLADWVSDPAHKLLIEGGEVGYVTLGASSGYPDFAANVLHSSAWNGDESGDLNLLSDYRYHSLVREPFSLPSVLELSVDGYYDQDSQRPLAPAYAIYCNAYHTADGGIIVYDNNDHPQSAQVIYYAFNFAALSDSQAARQLIVNSVDYLLADENPPVGAISGRADLTNRNDDRSATISLSGAMNRTTLTDSLGNYKFENLYDGYYELKASKTGYYCADSVIRDIRVAQTEVTDQNFQFDPILNGIVRGVVTLDRAPDYSGVVILISGQNLLDTTATDGSFSITNVQPGAISVFFNRAGYAMVRIDTTLGNGAELILSVTMFKDLPVPRDFSAVGGLDGVVRLSWQKPIGYEESFETGIPVNWTIGNYGTNPLGAGWTTSTNYAYDGTTSAVCKYGGTEEVSSEWLITNRVAITDLSRVLKFWHMGSFTSDDNLPNYIRISTSSTDTADFEIIRTFPGEPEALPAVWTQVAVDLSQYLDLEIYIAFQYQSKFGENWYIDQVTLESDTVVAPAEKHFIEPPVAKTDAALTKSGSNRSPFNSLLGQKEKSLEQYYIYRAEASGVSVADENLITHVATTQMEYSDLAVVNGQTYYYVIAADYGTDGLSAASAEVSATPQNLAPPAPQNFTATLTDSLVWLKWSHVGQYDLAGYRLYRQASTYVSFYLLSQQADTVYTDTLKSDNVYSYYVVAFDNGDPALSSSLSTIRVVRYGKLPPTDLTAKSNCNGFVPLAWSPPDSTDFASQGLQLTNYRLYRSLTVSVTAGSANLLADIAPGDTTYLDTAVINGTTYYYIVAAIYGDKGTSRPSNEVSATPDKPSAPPDLIVVSRIDAVRLKWTDINKDTGVKMKRGGIRVGSQSEKGSDFFTVYRSQDGVRFEIRADSITATTFVDGNVSPGGTYWYYICATVAGTVSDPSAVVKVTVLGHAQVILFDDFETGTIADQYILRDNDGGDGFVQYNPDVFQPQSWIIRSAPEYAAVNGDYSVCTGYNEDGTANDDWFIFPCIHLSDSGAFFEVFLSSQDEDYIEDAQIMISTGSSGISDFSVLSNLAGISADPEWLTVQVDLANYAGRNIYLAVRCISEDKFVLKMDNPGFYGNGSIVNSGMNPAAILPEKFSISQNFPNPFNPLTTIAYQLPEEAAVSLIIYNTMGQKIKTLISARQPANYYSVIWNGTNDAGQSVATGIYLYRFSAGNFHAVQKMVFLK